MALSAQLPVSISASGDNTVIAAQSGRNIEVLGLLLSLASETTVQFKSGSTAISGPQTMLSLLLDEKAAGRWYVTNQGEAFVISLGAAVQTGGTIWYRYV